MARPARRCLTFVLLLVASVGAVASLNVATFPVTLALAAPSPLPPTDAAPSWERLVDLLIRVLSLLLAWLVKPRDAKQDEDPKTFP